MSSAQRFSRTSMNWAPMKAKARVLIVLPTQQLSKNHASGKCRAPAAMPARSKKGLGMAERVRMVAEPFALHPSFQTMVHLPVFDHCSSPRSRPGNPSARPGASPTPATSPTRRGVQHPTHAENHGQAGGGKNHGGVPQ